MNTLKGLGPGVRPLVNADFRRGVEPTVSAEPFLEDLNLDREISSEPLRSVIDEAKRRYPPERSDAWLAPRVHATIRLTRREAGDKRLWNYLTIVAFPDYVRWRFFDASKPEEPVPLDRFLGEDSKNALARLWWAAELTRNGNDYSPTMEALTLVRFFVSWQPMDFMHHRPAALAATRFLKGFNSGKGATAPQSEALSKAFNLTLTTLSLDTLCDNPAVDAESLRDWCVEPVDETKMMQELPLGPDEGPVPEEAIYRVEAVLQRLADEINLKEVKRPRAQQKSVTAQYDSDETMAS